MSTVLLEIVTPERKVYSEDVTMVVVKGAEGDLGILPHHMPLVTPLKIAPVKIIQGDRAEYVAVSGGFLEVSPQAVTILAETAELSGEIDLERAISAKTRAEERMSEKDREAYDFARVQLALQRAMMRIQTKQKKS